MTRFGLFVNKTSSLIIETLLAFILELAGNKIQKTEKEE